MSRKIYTKEFKEQAVKLSYVSGKSVAETASDLGLPVNMLHRWRREAKLTGRVFPGRGIARDEELAELKKRVKQAELERDILKKAVSFLQRFRSDLSIHQILQRALSTEGLVHPPGRIAERVLRLAEAGLDSPGPGGQTAG